MAWYLERNLIACRKLRSRCMALHVCAAQCSKCFVGSAASLLQMIKGKLLRSDTPATLVQMKARFPVLYIYGI